jgi:hypothetical protein
MTSKVDRGGGDVPDDIARWTQHLATALGAGDDTLILASLSADGGMVRQSRIRRPRDLVALAQSLLDEARDLLDVEEISDEDDTLLGQVQDALHALPDPLADEDDTDA